MKSLRSLQSFRYLVPALCAAGILGSVAVAQTTPPGPSAGHHWHHHGHGAGLWHVLKQLNLTPAQETAIKSAFATAKTEDAPLRASIRANLQALAVTAPSDSSYPGLIATAKSNAAARIDAMSNLKIQIYAVLSPQQIAAIPGLVAADEAAWKSKAHGPHAPPPGP
jgi:Spy/CpxP family protein refolding chaperone